MTRRFFINTLALAAGVVLSPVCFANARHTYSGAVCKAAPSATQTGTNNVDYPIGPTYGIRNNNPYTTMPIICPIVQDAVSNSNGLSFVFVYWTAANNTDHIVCGLKSLNMAGTAERQAFGGLSGTGWIQNFPKPPITQDSPPGSYVLDCQLPPGGILNTIYYEEVE